MSSAEKLMENPESRFMGLFIGRSGGGKTTAALSFPHPIKVLDLDMRIRGGLSNSWIEAKGIDYEAYPPRSKTATYEKLHKDLEMLLIMQDSGQQMYQTLVLDSITFETILFLMDAVKLTHTDKKTGRWLGDLPMASPAEYGFQSTATYTVLSFLKSLAIPNIIVSAHLINKFGKDPSENNDYAPNIIIGEQLSMTDKLAEAIPTYFDHVYRFSKKENGQRVQYFVKTDGELERSAYIGLPREEEITGKDFYKWITEKIQRKTK